jgi:hypothetical protein
MARSRKIPPSLDATLFATPEQKVLRLLLSEPTTSFSIRMISSRLKGIRGLGGVDGLMKILKDLEALGVVDFVDNQRAVRLADDKHPMVTLLKTLVALCDLEGLRSQLGPLSTKVILHGSRANGTNRTDSDYNLLVVSNSPDEVKRIASGHPLGKLIEVKTFTPDAFGSLEKQDPKLANRVTRGIVVWGSNW